MRRCDMEDVGYGSLRCSMSTRGHSISSTVHSIRTFCDDCVVGSGLHALCTGE